MATRAATGARAGKRSSGPAREQNASGAALTREQKLELYYYMRLTRSLEERLQKRKAEPK